MKGKLEELSLKDLEKLLADSKQDLRIERFKAVTSKVDNPKKIKVLKKTIARVLTLQREYALGIRPSREQ
ncbi:MAG: 50S ribosomal protein L29 [Spirochaetes bacterium]|nr:50S ribosomal protein L29 [Spirochaetota bacterium]